MPSIEKHGEAIPLWLKIVRRQMASLRFGVIQIVVHDSHVTQIELTEKLRLERGPDEETQRASRDKP
jgi:hypothetical protein